MRMQDVLSAENKGIRFMTNLGQKLNINTNCLETPVPFADMLNNL